MIQTVPNMSFFAAFSARPTFWVNTDAARPYGTPLAQASASSSSENFCTVTTGPKTSFCTISESCLTSVTIVGWMKKPFDPFVSPPVRIVAFALVARSRKPVTRSCCDFEITGPISTSSPSAGSATLSDSIAGTSSSTSFL